MAKYRERGEESDLIWQMVRPVILSSAQLMLKIETHGGKGIRFLFKKFHGKQTRKDWMGNEVVRNA